MNNSNIKRNLEILDAFEQIKGHKNYYKYIEYLAIDNILISTTVRVINAKANKVLKKEVIKCLHNYVSTNFSSYKNNEYINSLTRNRKIIYRLLLLKQYWIIRLIFIMKGR